MAQLNSLNFTTLPKLKRIISLSGSQRRDTVPSNWGTMVLENLPELQEVHLQGNSLMNFDAMELRSLPKLECFVFEVQEESFMYSLKFNSCFHFLVLLRSAFFYKSDHRRRNGYRFEVSDSHKYKNTFSTMQTFLNSPLLLWEPM